MHAGVHNAVGGDMATASSPEDPLFWLHHANLDRLWAKWQASPIGSDPSNKNEHLRPAGIMNHRKVSDVLSITVLGYEYV